MLAANLRCSMSSRLYRAEHKPALDCQVTLSYKYLFLVFLRDLIIFSTQILSFQKFSLISFQEKKLSFSRESLTVVPCGSRKGYPNRTPNRTLKIFQQSLALKFVPVVKNFDTNFVFILFFGGLFLNGAFTEFDKFSRNLQEHVIVVFKSLLENSVHKCF